MIEKRRRNALKALAVGTPVVWAKPVVDSVILPAHAQITVACVQINTAGSLYALSADFSNGNYLPCNSTIFTDANCTIAEPRTTGNAHAYAPTGQEEADQICSSSGGLGSGGGLRAPNVYACDGCDSP